MKKIYKIIADLRKDFVKMTYGITTDKNEVDEVVQELMLYFLQMNSETLKGIYDKDGEKGIIKYGAVVIKEAYKVKTARTTISIKNTILT